MEIKNKINLVNKHFVYFFKALIETIFLEKGLLNLIVLLLWFATYYFFKASETDLNLIYGAYLAILITANLQTTADRCRNFILWDGNWRIIKNEEYNFEHKKSIYISLFGELSNIISMIVNFFGVSYRDGRIMSVTDFDNIAERYDLWRFENKKTDFNVIDEYNSYQKFSDYVKYFSNIETIIASIQNLQNHINIYCPFFNIKSSLALLLSELFVTKSNVDILKKFIKASKPEHDSLKWKLRLRELLERKNISVSCIENNIRNLVIYLSLLYKDINEDFNFNNV